MNIKINWGFGIIVTFILFFIILGIMAFISFSNPSDLVTKGYYEKELKYQDEIDKMKNTAELINKPSIEKIDVGILVRFPDDIDHKNVTGNIKLYKPSDSKYDFEEELILDDDRTFLIQNSKFSPGLYKVQLNWSVDNKKFYDERSINF